MRKQFSSLYGDFHVVHVPLFRHHVTNETKHVVAVILNAFCACDDFDILDDFGSASPKYISVWFEGRLRRVEIVSWKIVGDAVENRFRGQPGERRNRSISG